MHAIAKESSFSKNHKEINVLETTIYDSVPNPNIIRPKIYHNQLIKIFS